jgi:hypothetical protein
MPRQRFKQGPLKYKLGALAFLYSNTRYNKLLLDSLLRHHIWGVPEKICWRYHVKCKTRGCVRLHASSQKVCYEAELDEIWLQEIQNDILSTTESYYENLILIDISPTKTFRNNMGFFYGEKLLAPRPTPQLEDLSLPPVRDCLFIIFAATLHILRPFPPSATWGRAMPWMIKSKRMR